MSGSALVPLLVDLTGLRVLFVGAGEGTRTKLGAFASLDVLVRVVAPVVSTAVAEAAARFDAEVFERPFSEPDLDGVALVYAMTDDEATNHRVANLCRQRGLWHNVAGNRGSGSFTNPAVARRDELIAAFSTVNQTPSVAVAARDAWAAAH